MSLKVPSDADLSCLFVSSLAQRCQCCFSIILWLCLLRLPLATQENTPQTCELGFEMNTENRIITLVYHSMQTLHKSYIRSQISSWEVVSNIYILVEEGIT